MQVTDQALQLRLSIMEKASTDEDFRQRLLADAKGAIKADFGVVLADEAQISIVEEEPQHVTIVLPNRSYDEVELAEVAGFADNKFEMIPDMLLFARNVENLMDKNAGLLQRIESHPGFNPTRPGK